MNFGQIKTSVGGVIKSLFSDDEQVTFYHSYGFREGSNWIIPMRVWVHETRIAADAIVAKVAEALGVKEPSKLQIFKSRITELLADDESGERVTFKFDNDPEGQEFQVQNNEGLLPVTDANGLIKGQITLSAAKAEQILGAKSGWLTLRATSGAHAGVGRVRLIEPEGDSVISDIDDTIKITEIPAGVQAVVRRTFFQDFESAPGMAEMYREFGDIPFHYVSGSPWQLNKPLAEFLFGQAGFPEGSFHMKDVRKNLLSRSTWNDWKELAAGDATFEQKVCQISTMMHHFPDRKFILIGDSGEKDPEVYSYIRNKFGSQVKEIRIRDIVNRLESMTIIPAQTVAKPHREIDCS